MKSESTCREQAIAFVYQCKFCGHYRALYRDQCKKQVVCTKCFGEEMQHTASVDPAIMLARLLNGDADRVRADCTEFATTVAEGGKTIDKHGKKSK